MLQNKKLLFIFKTADFDELSNEVSVDDNIYKKVKSLSSSLEELKIDLKERLFNIEEHIKEIKLNK